MVSGLWGLTGFITNHWLYNKSVKNQSSFDLSPFVSLQNTLDLLLEQARSYEQALPASNYPARAAVSALARLAQQAKNEALSLAETLQSPHPADQPCSPRETEVLNLTSEGLTNKEIAYRLGISERTVQFHLNSIFNKTGAQSRTEAVALALKNGWIGVIASRT